MSSEPYNFFKNRDPDHRVLQDVSQLLQGRILY